MYNRYENGVHPREPIMDILSALKDHSSSLDDHVQYLESVSSSSHSVKFSLYHCVSHLTRYKIYTQEFIFTLLDKFKACIAQW